MFVYSSLFGICICFICSYYIAFYLDKSLLFQLYLTLTSKNISFTLIFNYVFKYVLAENIKTFIKIVCLNNCTYNTNNS